MNNLSSGQITNLISNDASQVDTVFYFLHYLWVWMKRSSAIFTLRFSHLGRSIGNNIGDPIFLAVCSLHCTDCCGIYSTTFNHSIITWSSICLSSVRRCLRIFPNNDVRIIYSRTRVLQFTDQRVKVMSEIISSMRIVKMYCWESAFEKRIRAVRRWVQQHSK